MTIAATDPNNTTGMRSWIGVQSARYYLVQTRLQFDEFMLHARQQHTIALDTETTGLNWVKDHACGLSFGWGLENNYYIPIRHKVSETQLDIDEIVSELREIVSNPKVTKVFWNATFDRHFLNKLGLPLAGPYHDGVVLVHLLDEGRSKGLKEVASDILDRYAGGWEEKLDIWRGEEARRRRSAFQELIRNTLQSQRISLEAKFYAMNPVGVAKADVTRALKEMVKEQLKDHPWANIAKADIGYDEAPLEVIGPYAASDVHYTFALYKRLLPEVAAHDQLRKLYVNEMSLSSVVFEVEEGGVQVDVDYLEDLEPSYVEHIDTLRAEIFQDAGSEFNLDSPQQLAAALQKVGCPLHKQTKAGDKLSVDKEVLDYLASEFEFAHKIVEYREKQKLLNTYVRAIRELLDNKKYLHSTYNTNVSTGRMSSRDPNLQNIPARSKDIRKAFTIPKDSDDYLFVFFDFSQIELRLTAHHSQDPTLLGAYPFDGAEKDVHSITCADVVMKRPVEEIMAILNDPKHPEYGDVKFFRNIAKRVNFGIIYGAGPKAIQRQVSTPKRYVSEEDCAEYIKQYFERYHGVATWIAYTQLMMRKQGFLQNSFGRYRRLPDALSSNRADKFQQQRAFRQGVNFLIQGDAADLFKAAVVRVRGLLQDTDARTRMVNFVHDEIQLYLHKQELHLLPLIKEAMEGFPQFRVPIRAEVEMSHGSWGDKKPLKTK